MKQSFAGRLLALLAVAALLAGVFGALLPRQTALAAGPGQESTLIAKSKKSRSTPEPTLMPTSDPANLPTVSPVPEGPIIEPQTIADYIFANGCLPDNFITKKEAQALGWDSSYNYLSDVAPGYSIGGDRFGNYEGILPTAKGRQYYECDCFYTTGKRNAYRLVFSNDGLVFYTEDHYQTFVELHPTVTKTAAP